MNLQTFMCFSLCRHHHTAGAFHHVRVHNVLRLCRELRHKPEKSGVCCKHTVGTTSDVTNVRHYSQNLPIVVTVCLNYCDCIFTEPRSGHRESFTLKMLLHVYILISCAQMNQCGNELIKTIDCI